MHYRSHCCETHKKTIELSSQENDTKLSRLIEKYLRELFNNREVSEPTRQKLWKKYYDKLTSGLKKGYKPALEFYDNHLVTALTNNIAEFSAFKESAFTKVLLEELTKGKLPTWSEFKESAIGINNKFNKSWLETEYHQTIATANMAEKWQQFERDSDLYPNIKYVTVGDARVRDEHKKWNGLILPINHPIWKKILPPNDWGCRCNVIQSDDPVTANIPSMNTKKEFNNNPIDSGKIFKDSPYENTLSIDKINKAKKDVKIFSKNEYTNAGKYVKIHVNADPSDLNRNLIVAKGIANKLKVHFEIREHVHTGSTNPEYLIRNKNLADRKSIEGLNNLRRNFKKAKDQMFNEIINPNKTPYHIVFDLDKIKDLNIKDLIKKLRENWQINKGRNIHSIFIYHKEKAIEITREEFLRKDYIKFKELL